MTASGPARIVSILCIMVAAESAWAQPFPTRPIRLVTSPAGGSSDFAARLLTPGLSSALNQQVIVDNRGGGVLPVEIVAKAPPDGHTLLYYGSTLWLIPLLQEVSYDTLRDFIPVSIVANSPVIVAVHPSLPVKSIKELIALAKAKPGALNYGSASAGSPSHLATELLKALAGINMVRISYKGTGPAMNALMAGEVQVFMTSSGGMTAHINSGRIRALAVTSTRRSASFPNLPTMAEAGVPGYEYGQMSGVFAPARTATAIVERLSAEIARVANSPDVKERLFNAGADADGSTPQEATARIKSEVARLGKVIRDAKIRAD
jgi:tripartite-type tricarboxylate transporter receptor subunit TctC